MYDQHIILDFEMNPVSKKNKEARRGLSREIIEIGAVKLNSKYEVVDKILSEKNVFQRLAKCKKSHE